MSYSSCALQRRKKASCQSFFSGKEDFGESRMSLVRIAWVGGSWQSRVFHLWSCYTGMPRGDPQVAVTATKFLFQSFIVSLFIIAD